MYSSKFLTLLSTWNHLYVGRSSEQTYLCKKYYERTLITGKHSKYNRQQLEAVLGNCSDIRKYCAVGKISKSSKLNDPYTTKVDLEELVQNMEDAGFYFI